MASQTIYHTHTQHMTITCETITTGNAIDHLPVQWTCSGIQEWLYVDTDASVATKRTKVIARLHRYFHSVH